MSEMIDRVALAICGDDNPANILAIHRTRARAAIEAMREPTGEMHEVGRNVNFGNYASEAWRAMIDAALSEKPKDITVACKCGWQGLQSELNEDMCPKCSAPFKAWP